MMANKKLRYISTFSGIEAATVAWESLGWEPVAFSEIDGFPSAVLAHRFPNVPNLGDITKVDWSDYNGAVDVLVGGSPCQSFSVAGKREGLSGESGLMFEYIRAVREVRPRYFVWENVPGALTSEKGEAFRQLLSEMDELGYGLAWRVLDAQFFGVAQRRRRVFLVGSLGTQRAAEILFGPESLRWDFKTGRAERQRLAADAQGGVGGGREDDCLAFKYHQGSKAGGLGEDWEVSPTLTADYHNPAACMAVEQNQRYEVRTSDVMGCLPASRSGKQIQAVCTSSAEPAYTAVVRCGCEGGGKGALVSEDCSMTLSTSNTQTVFQPTGFREGSFGQYVQEEAGGTLKASGGVVGGGSETFVVDGSQVKYIVRRLTPRECERLQGFPDDWTRIEWKGKPADECPDGPRYKALGNSMAVPVMRWIGERIQKEEE